MKELILWKAKDIKTGRFLRQTREDNYNGLAIYYDKKGYATVWLNNKNVKVHVLEWEKHNGKKPPGHEIHHIDENKANWNIKNLELLSNSDHQKVHAGWVKENGVWAKKPCKDCKRLLTLDKFYPRKGLTPLNRCIECSAKLFKLRNDEAYKAYRKIYMKNYYKNNKDKWENY